MNEEELSFLFAYVFLLIIMTCEHIADAWSAPLIFNCHVPGCE
jgi:hypothetical protein